MSKLALMRTDRYGRRLLPEGFDSYDYGLCPSCGVWQQLLDWSGTHRLTCPAEAQRRPLLLAKRGTRTAYRVETPPVLKAVARKRAETEAKLQARAREWALARGEVKDG